MKREINVIFMFFIICFLSANTDVNKNFQFNHNDHLYIGESKQPYVLMSHKDLIVKINANKEREIIYENLQRSAGINNTRNTLLRLYFNQDQPGFVILDENNVFGDHDAIWINETTAEISVPEGIYKICTHFYVDSFWRLVINSDVDLTSGGVVEVFIEHNQACYLLEHNGVDIYNEPFDISDKYYANFRFHFLEHPFFLGFINFTNRMFTSGFSEDIVFVAGELKHDEDSIYITQHGPFLEIDSDLSFSNESVEYSQQQLTLDIPASIANPKIALANMYWSDTGEGFFFYWGICVENYLLECNDDQWIADLYMMNNVYTATGNTTEICVCSLEDELFIDNYFTSPFHCIDGSIGSFLNFVPTIVDYLSPDGEQLFFGQSPLFIKSFHTYDDNLFCPYISIYGYNNEARDDDRRNSLFSLFDANGYLFAEGELPDLWDFYLPPDEYTLVVENTNFSLKGLDGTSRLINVFDSSLEMPNPPYINAFQIRNEDGKPVNQLGHNESSSLLISIADSELIGNEYVYFPVITDSVKAFYKEHYAETWSELDVEFIHDYDDYHTWTFGKVFSADLSDLTAIDSVAYDLKISTKDVEENYTVFTLEPAFTVGDFDATSISDNEIILENYQLSHYPNPFNPSTTISFSVTQTSSFVTLEIYNLKGQKVKTLVNERLDSGLHSYTWHGNDNSGKAVSSGIYFYRLKTGNGKFTSTKKMILMK